MAATHIAASGLDRRRRGQGWRAHGCAGAGRREPSAGDVSRGVGHLRAGFEGSAQRRRRERLSAPAARHYPGAGRRQVPLAGGPRGRGSDPRHPRHGRRCRSARGRRARWRLLRRPVLAIGQGAGRYRPAGGGSGRGRAGRGHPPGNAPGPHLPALAQAPSDAREHGHDGRSEPRHRGRAGRDRQAHLRRRAGGARAVEGEPRGNDHRRRARQGPCASRPPARRPEDGEGADGKWLDRGHRARGAAWEALGCVRARQAHGGALGQADRERAACEAPGGQGGSQG